jgi:hypothetical protein
MEKYDSFVAWCRENGCIFPSIEYPAKIPPYDIIGARAKANIPSKKAFIFVPNKVIITPEKAKHSEIGFIIEANTGFFSHPIDGDDFCLYLFLMFERTKGESSFWHHYFECVAGLEMLMFWDDIDIDTFEDPDIKGKALVMLEKYNLIWNQFAEIIA